MPQRFHNVRGRASMTFNETLLDRRLAEQMAYIRDLKHDDEIIFILAQSPRNLLRLRLDIRLLGLLPFTVCTRLMHLL